MYKKPTLSVTTKLNTWSKEHIWFENREQEGGEQQFRSAECGKGVWGGWRYFDPAKTQKSIFKTHSGKKGHCDALKLMAAKELNGNVWDNAVENAWAKRVAEREAFLTKKRDLV